MFSSWRVSVILTAGKTLDVFTPEPNRLGSPVRPLIRIFDSTVDVGSCRRRGRRIASCCESRFVLEFLIRSNPEPQ
jgi:hypothetical protein